MRKILVLMLILVSVNVFGSNGTEIRDALIDIIAVIVSFIPAILTSGKKNGKAFLIWTVFLWWTLIVPLVLLIITIIDISNENAVKCPYCKEKIKKDAVVCKHCQKNLTEQK